MSAGVLENLSAGLVFFTRGIKPPRGLEPLNFNYFSAEETRGRRSGGWGGNTYAINPSAASYDAVGGSGTVNVTVPVDSA